MESYYGDAYFNPCMRHSFTNKMLHQLCDDNINLCKMSMQHVTHKVTVVMLVAQTTVHPDGTFLHAAYCLTDFAQVL